MTSDSLGPLLYLGADDVSALSRTIDPLAVAGETFLAVWDGRAGVTPEAALRWASPDGAAARSLVLPAWHDDTYGCKIINACLGNPARGLPRAHGLIVLADPLTAAPVCIMEGARISALRTAAVSLTALGAVRDLAQTASLALLGCGRQARTHLELLAVRAELEQVVVYDSDDGRGEEFVRYARRLLPTAVVEHAGRPEEAVRSGQVTLASTTTDTPYVEPEWLPEGAVFLNVSLDDATEALLMGCDHLFVDDWALVAKDSTRLLGRLAQSGRITGPGQVPPADGRQTDAEVATLLAGTYHRAVAATDRIVINPFGMGVHDIALAARIHEAALKREVGTWLPR